MSAYKTLGKAVQQQPLVYNSLKKHGVDSHIFSIVEQFKSNNDYASGKEMFWIRSYMSNLNKWRCGFGMNLTDGGDGTTGRVVSEETKKKIGEGHRGKRLSEQQKLFLSEFNKKNPPMGMRGKKHTQSAKDAMSKKKKGMVSIFKGKHHTEENKKRASELRKGKPNLNRRGKGLWSEDDKKRIGASKIGNTNTKGIRWSDEVKRNMMLGKKEKCKVIVQYSLDGTLIKEHISKRDAARNTGMSRHSINEILYGVTKTPTKFKFAYK
jgi:group I intron endonuclease